MTSRLVATVAGAIVGAVALRRIEVAHYIPPAPEETAQLLRRRIDDNEKKLVSYAQELPLLKASIRELELKNDKIGRINARLEKRKGPTGAGEWPQMPPDGATAATDVVVGLGYGGAYGAMRAGGLLASGLGELKTWVNTKEKEHNLKRLTETVERQENFVNRILLKNVLESEEEISAREEEIRRLQDRIKQLEADYDMLKAQYNDLSGQNKGSVLPADGKTAAAKVVMGLGYGAGCAMDSFANGMEKVCEVTGKVLAAPLLAAMERQKNKVAIEERKTPKAINGTTVYGLNQSSTAQEEVPEKRHLTAWEITFRKYSPFSIVVRQSTLSTDTALYATVVWDMATTISEFIFWERSTRRSTSNVATVLL
ncbi:hypothetical protein AAVH_30507, partial [Aphelenchoides avenae]